MEATAVHPSDGMDKIGPRVADLLIGTCGFPSPVVCHGLKQFALNRDVLSVSEADHAYLRMLLEVGHAIFMVDAYALLYTATVDGTLNHAIETCVDVELRTLLKSSPSVYREGIPSRALSAFAQGLADLAASTRLHVATLFKPWLQEPHRRGTFLECCIQVRHEARYIVATLSLVNQLHKQSINNIAAYKNNPVKGSAPLLTRGIHLYNYLLNLLDKNGYEQADAVLRMLRPVAQEIASMIHSFLINGYLSDPYSEFFAVPVELQEDEYEHNVLDNKFRNFLYCFDADKYTQIMDKIVPPTYVAVVAPGCSLLKNHFPVFLKTEQAKKMVMAARCARIAGVSGETRVLVDELRDIVGLRDARAFNRISFDRCLDKLVRLSSQSLWIHLLQHGVLNHLKVLFEIAFLRQADVAQCILDGASRAMKTPTTAKLMTRTFNVALEKAFSLCYRYFPSPYLKFEAFCERKTGAREVPLLIGSAERADPIDQDMLRFIVDDFANGELFMYDEQKELFGLFELVYTEYSPQNELLADHLLYQHMVGSKDADGADADDSTRLLTLQQIEMLPTEKQFKHKYRRSVRQPFYDSELSIYPIFQHARHERRDKHFPPISNHVFKLLALKFSCDSTTSLFLAPHYISLCSKIFKTLLSLKYTHTVAKSTYLLFLRKTPSRMVFTLAYGRGSTRLKLAPKFDKLSAFGLQVLVLRIVPYIISSIILFFDRLSFFLEIKHLGPRIAKFTKSLAEISRACYDSNEHDNRILGFVNASDLINNFLCSLVVKFFLKDDKTSSMLRYICELANDFCSLITRATESRLLTRALEKHLQPPTTEYQYFYSQVVAYKKELEDVTAEFEETIKSTQ